MTLTSDRTWINPIQLNFDQSASGLGRDVPREFRDAKHRSSKDCLGGVERKRQVTLEQ